MGKPRKQPPPPAPVPQPAPEEEEDEVEDEALDDDFGAEEEGEAGDEGYESGDEDEDDDDRLAQDVAALEAQQQAEAQQELEEAAEAGDAEDDGDESVLPTAAPKAVTLEQRRARLQKCAIVLHNAAKRLPGSSRADYEAVFKKDLQAVYDYSDWLIDRICYLLPPSEVLEFMEANEKPRPVTLRTNTLKAKRKELAKQLMARGVNLDPLEKWSHVGLVVYDSTVPVGGTPEYLAGHYMLQAAVSFLPVVALDPKEGERILDMAAAPGGKTTYIGQLMKNTGALFANDVEKTRVKSLAANLQRLGVSNAIITNLDGRQFPRFMRNSMDRVLLDAPCTGTGIISRDPKIKNTKQEREVLHMSHQQKELLLAAIDCCKPGGVVVYSTCSILIEENEDVVDYALRRRNVELVDTGIPIGKRAGVTSHVAKHYHPSLRLTKRYYPHVHNFDGFYVAKLVKRGDVTPLRKGSTARTASLPAAQGERLHAPDAADDADADTSARKGKRRAAAEDGATEAVTAMQEDAGGAAQDEGDDLRESAAEDAAPAAAPEPAAPAKAPLRKKKASAAADPAKAAKKPRRKLAQ